MAKDKTTTVDVVDRNGNRRASFEGDNADELNGRAQGEIERLNKEKPNFAPFKVGSVRPVEVA